MGAARFGVRAHHTEPRRTSPRRLRGSARPSAPAERHRRGHARRADRRVLGDRFRSCGARRRAHRSRPRVLLRPRHAGLRPEHAHRDRPCDRPAPVPRADGLAPPGTARAAATSDCRGERPRGRRRARPLPRRGRTHVLRLGVVRQRRDPDRPVRRGDGNELPPPADRRHERRRRLDALGPHRVRRRGLPHRARQ